ncbi:MAG: hypothetical protein AAF560_07490 [Acidobacteriota bacterium]
MNLSLRRLPHPELRHLATTLSKVHLAVLLLTLGPAPAMAGRAEGTSDSIRNQTAIPFQPGSPVPFKELPLGWDPNPTVMTPWCTLDVAKLQDSCNHGGLSCGGSTIPCRSYEGGVTLRAAGTGLRNSRTGTIQLRGFLEGSQPVVAWLIWSVIDRNTINDEPRGGTIDFAADELVGLPLPESREPCWTPTPTGFSSKVSVADPTVLRTFIADVTSQLEPDLNGDYSIELAGSSIESGGSPWGSTLDQEEGFTAEGASLVVVATHPEIPSEAMVSFHAHPTFVLGDTELHHDLELPIPDGTLVEHLRIGADGQTEASNHLVAGYRTLFGGAPDQWVVLRGEGSSIDVHRDWLGADGGSTQQLWDTAVTRAQPSQLGLAVGSGSYRVRYELEHLPAAANVRYDCLNVLFHGLSIR